MATSKILKQGFSASIVKFRDANVALSNLCMVKKLNKTKNIKNKKQKKYKIKK